VRSDATDVRTAWSALSSAVVNVGEVVRAIDIAAATAASSSHQRPEALI
jgi:hypothetical protein